MGNVVQAGNGQNPARIAGVRGGLSTCVPAVTFNDVCLASMTATGVAASLVRSGEEPLRMNHPPIKEIRDSAVSLLRDLQDLYLLAALVQTSWTVVEGAAEGARDRELTTVAQECSAQTARQLTWLRTRMKEAAPQALLVAT